MDQAQTQVPEAQLRNFFQSPEGRQTLQDVTAPLLETAITAYFATPNGVMDIINAVNKWSEDQGHNQIGQQVLENLPTVIARYFESPEGDARLSEAITSALSEQKTAQDSRQTLSKGSAGTSDARALETASTGQFSGAQQGGQVGQGQSRPSAAGSTTSGLTASSGFSAGSAASQSSGSTSDRGREPA
jgi:hypothetical protein